MTHQSSFDFSAPRFGGVTYDENLDGKRLNRQLLAVKAHMLGTGWQTLREIADATGFPEASISARLRDLRKAAFGGYMVERQRRGSGKNGLHEYRVQPAP